MKPTGAVVVTRTAEGLQDRYASYRVMIDGRERGRIKAGETRSFNVPPGEHRIRLAVSWLSSPELHFAMDDRESQTFECGPAGSPAWVFWRTVFRPRRYIDLNQT